MRPINKFWWFAVLAVLATLVVFVVIFMLLWKELTFEEKRFLLFLVRKHFIYLFGALVLAVAGVGFALDAFFNTFIIPLIKLSEETNIINTVNPTHRIRIEAAKEVQNLVSAINEMAERHEVRDQAVQAHIAKACAQSELEKNILAVFLSELSEGVLICNEQGCVTFFNRQARYFFETADNGVRSDGLNRYVGIGRSVFDIIDKHVITYALDEISNKLEKQETEALAHFIVPDQKGHLVNVETAPILNTHHEFAGFILVLRDMSIQMETENHLYRLFQTLCGQTRSSVASIRSAIETLRTYPQMLPSQGAVFQEIIYKEALALSGTLNTVSADHAHPPRSRWPMIAMPLISLLFGIQHKAIDRVGIHIAAPVADESIWVRCDRYTLTLAMLFLLSRVSEFTGIKDYSIETAAPDQFIHIDFSWAGRPVTTDMLKKWEEALLAVGTEALPLTLRDTIGHHDGELCSLRDPDKATAAVRLILPVSYLRPAVVRRKLTILPKSRPEFFDFDLFHQAGQTPELDRMPLSAIPYTVFDTETTGLDPDGGDKIISIGALRIVNGRLLRNDPFDQLIDPKRPLSLESIRIHGIESAMLEGRPEIDAVLPLFKKYCQETVLVAHNAAFDLKMLTIAGGRTGVSLINPVLDTLLLSAFVHPAQSDHTIEAIAQRLGIDVVSRHTALGDALIAGQVFLKLIPLMEKMGIHTLGDARRAAEKTYYARLKY